jgi:hypothetical protein
MYKKPKMKIPHLFLATLVGSLSHLLAAAPASDISSSQNREATVQLARQLAREIHRVPATATPSPFNPADFDAPDETNKGPKQPSVAAPPKSDREILEALALRFPANGTIARGSKIFLTAGRKQFEAGQIFTLSELGHDYEVELTAVSATAFTLRYRNETFTRPVR